MISIKEDHFHEIHLTLLENCKISCKPLLTENDGSLLTSTKKRFEPPCLKILPRKKFQPQTIKIGKGLIPEDPELPLIPNSLSTATSLRKEA
ncbi:hypothetical protein CDAR_169891 [Caerostris darwini]|uniref:Uncharacterized protein n=1 Tax=Caerostris darwini TaxID=1538125 RepID=A0AAV4TVG2_9ARAC|nr:hypothetical protein CDAR_169891 [Caerostris darwini]